MSIPLSGAQTGAAANESGYHGVPMLDFYSDPVAEHRAVRESAGLFDLTFRTIVSAKGGDRARFLHNMVTNDVKGLTPGGGVYANVLDVKGHILADLRIYCDQDQFLLATDADLVEKVLATLSRYNIGGRVPLERLSLAALSLQGPKAGEILSGIVGASLPGPEELTHAVFNFKNEPVRVIRYGFTGETGFELWASPAGAQLFRQAVLDAGRSGGVTPCGSAALETLRIEAGIPVYGNDLAEDTLPLEAGLLNALSFNKGCYIGQEIVERARSRGRVNWKLVGMFVGSSEFPPAGAKLLREGKPLGEVTSACVSPTLGRTIAMGYVRREVSEPGNLLALESGPEVEITALPFYQRN
ncbi:MAG: aminomethyltransferase family protein [Acidobacteriota bacterium]|nr:aminomethyltransferase family protein [Acidobacteriota bacterium]